MKRLASLQFTFLLLMAGLLLAGCQDSLTGSASEQSPTAGSPTTNGSTSSCTVTVSSDIQDAVSSANSGAVVCVEPGTYEESVSISVEDLTLRSTGSGTATILGQTDEAVTIDADGVTVKDLTVTNPDRLLGIGVTAGQTGVLIQGNVVKNVGPTSNSGVTGIIAREPQTDLTITKNTVKDIVQEEFYNTAQGIFLDDVGGGGVENSEITKNAVTNVSSEAGSIGILVNADLTNGTIQGNDVSGISAVKVGGFDFSQGLNLTGTMSNVDVVRNRITDISAESIVPEAVKIDGDGSGATFRRNDFVAAIGFNNQNGASDAPSVDVKCNWWGTKDGPEEADNNQDADRDQQADLVGNADASKWLTGPFGEPGSGCNGGRGGGPPQNVPGNGPGGGNPGGGPGN